jgi:hypothetical protein
MQKEKKKACLKIKPPGDGNRGRRGGESPDNIICPACGHA